VELLVGETGGGGAKNGVGLHGLRLKHLLFCGGLGSRGELSMDAVSIEPPGNAINDLPGGIREL